MCRFEGDGCVHATRIKDGKASFCNHFVRTHRFKEEQRAGFPIYAKVSSSCLQLLQRHPSPLERQLAYGGLML